MNNNLDVYDFLDEGGLLSKAFPSYEYREGQIEMSLLVQKAYNDNAIAMIEAGTGIGKSFAYLVPAIIYAMKNSDDNRTVIATATKNLQLQLSNKDVPLLLSLIHEDIKVSVLFGRSNYICRRRFEEAYRSVELLAQDSESDMAKMNDFVENAERGLFQDYTGHIPDGLRAACMSDMDLCHGGQCPFMSSCFYFRAKRAAQEAQIIITNHHLLFTDAESRLEAGLSHAEDCVLPAFSRLIIDEAHNIEQNATDLFTGVYSFFEVSRQIGLIMKPRYGRQASIMEDLSRYSTEKDCTSSIYEAQKNLSSKMETLDTYLAAYLAKLKASSRLLQNSSFEGSQDFYLIGNEVVKLGVDFVNRLSIFAKNLKYSDDERQFVDEFSTLVSRVNSSFEILKDFCDKDNWTDDVHYIRQALNRKQLVQEICISPISIQQKMREGIFNEFLTVVCTSATLNLNDDFAFWSSRVGLPVDGREILKLEVASPFDYRNNLLLLTPSDAPIFKENESEAFEQYASETIFNAICSSGGGALVLFTSNKMMAWMKNELKAGLERKGMKTMMQGDKDRYQLLKDFKEDVDSVLFATNSFWEGIDAPGEALRMVIIVKLPFQAPNEPILKARVKKIEEQKQSGFYFLSLPDATMKLKQGFGRLIRNKTDKGVVLILDSRIITKNYGQYMLHALPESYNPETETSGICTKIENFLFS